MRRIQDATWVPRVAGTAFVAAVLVAAQARAGEISAAVAANFTEPAKVVAEAFKAKTGYTVDLSFGASGQLYAQITQGAPFDMLLSADAERPAKAEKEGWGVAGTRFTYAIGKLVLWSTNAALVDKEGAVLKTGNFSHLAIANPKAAPYGAAAIAAMNTLGVYKAIESKIVTGENIGQTYQFVASGNAELGFVALSQIVADTKGSRWVVPQALYPPILQDAILLKQGEQNSFATAFLDYLKSPEALKVIAGFGYDLPAKK